MKTMICLILDRSGSMSGREADVIGGVNTFIEEQKKLTDPASIAFVRFDTEAVERFRPMQAIAECKPLDNSDFVPRGGTPLLDAIGKTLSDLEADWKTEQPERAILVIVTDGAENSSCEYTKPKIKEMIESRQASGKWAIVYLGANVDAFGEANAMGIPLSNTGGYKNTSMGTKMMYDSVSVAVSHMRATGSTKAHNLGRNIGEDDDQKKHAVQMTAMAPQVRTKLWTPPQPSGTWTTPQ